MIDSPTRLAPFAIELPRDPRLVRVARLAVRSAATDLAFDVASLEDLAMGVNELATAAMTAMDADATLRLTVETDQFGITVRGVVVGGASAVRMSHLATAILDRTADRWSLTAEGEGVSFWLVRLSPEVA